MDNLWILQNTRTRLLSLLKEHAYQYQKEPFKLQSGKESHYYVNCRRVLMSHEGANAAATLVLAYMYSRFSDIDGIAGVVLGSVPLVDEIVAQDCVDGGNTYRHILGKAYVRKEAKDHGTKQIVEMDFRLAKRVLNKQQSRVLLVEDVWTTGESAMKAKKVLEDTGFTVVSTIVVVDRQEPDTERPDFALCTLADLQA